MIICLGFIYCIFLTVIQSFEVGISDNDISGFEPEHGARIVMHDTNEGNSQNCDLKLKNSMSVIAHKPSIRLVHTKKEESKVNVKRRHLNPKHCGTQTKELEPRKSVKVETYTETYTVTQIKHRTLTRKHRFIQRRRLIQQKINKPILVVKRKVIKERQTYERVVPKVIETREIINNPKLITQIVTDPVEEVTEEGIHVSVHDDHEGSAESVIEEDSLVVESGANDASHGTIVVDSGDHSGDVVFEEGGGPQVVVEDHQHLPNHLIGGSGDTQHIVIEDLSHPVMSSAGSAQHVIIEDSSPQQVMVQYGGPQQVLIQEGGPQPVMVQGGGAPERIVIANDAMVNAQAEIPVHIKVNEQQGFVPNEPYYQQGYHVSAEVQRSAYSQPIYNYGKRK